jgi:probable HAF family extracellular repeat protein
VLPVAPGQVIHPATTASPFFPNVSNRLYKVNNGGMAVGFYDDSSSQKGFLYDTTTNSFPSAGLGGLLSFDGSFALSVGAIVDKFGLGINDAGDIVGSFYDAGSGAVHCFLIDGTSGAITQIAYPGASNTSCSGINNVGQITGAFEDASGYHHAFLRSAVGVFTLITPADAHPGNPALYIPHSVVATGLNDAGDVVGHYIATDGDVHGFLYKSGSITTIAYPGANAESTEILDINNSGQMVGSFWDNSDLKIKGFLLENF